MLCCTFSVQGSFHGHDLRRRCPTRSVLERARVLTADDAVVIIRKSLTEKIHRHRWFSTRFYFLSLSRSTSGAFLISLHPHVGVLDYGMLLGRSEVVGNSTVFHNLLPYSSRHAGIHYPRDLAAFREETSNNVTGIKSTAVYNPQILGPSGTTSHIPHHNTPGCSPSAALVVMINKMRGCMGGPVLPLFKGKMLFPSQGIMSAGVGREQFLHNFFPAVFQRTTPYRIRHYACLHPFLILLAPPPPP